MCAVPWGFNPLMIGAPSEPQRRFTPTCVGNAPPSAPRIRETTVHPHVCGECSVSTSGSPPSSGSPPRVWGMRSVRSARRPNRRFTPTCVGNARRQGPCRRTPSVHPHVCGECGPGTARPMSLLGSPPRVWGMPLRPHGEPLGRRFTPTCVGNASGMMAETPMTAVHPHVCGECFAASFTASATAGSPPRVWGMPVDVDEVAADHRFTPTCVGNAASPLPHPEAGPVHPHVCGECLGAG